jgi:hypothetical protein
LLVETDDLTTTSVGSDGRSVGSEGSRIVGRIEAIVDALAEQGIASPSNVAMSGFSRSGYQTHYLMTHPARTRFAAASVADSFTMNYPQYLEQMARTPAPVSYQAVGRSFWQEPDYWLAREVTFNADRVQTPILFSENDAEDSFDPVGSLHTIGALRLNSKPVEYLYFTNAIHQLRRPLQRVAMMSSVVDWMAFWLLGEENPEPARAAQYERWRKMRADWLAIERNTVSGGRGGFINTRSGIAYAIDKRVSGVPAQDGDELTIEYAAETSSVDTGPRASITKHRISLEVLGSELRRDERLDARVPPGTAVLPVSVCREGLALMHEGERAIFLVPRRLPESTGAEGGAQSDTARYEVEIVSIKRRSRIAPSR